MGGKNKQHTKGNVRIPVEALEPNMAKKRIKSKVSQASESTDNLEPTCAHIRKGLEQGNLKKALPEAEWNICQDCQTDNKIKENMEEEIVEIPSVWMCLKCGHRGCDRNSQEKHALHHYNTPRSDCHCLVLSLDNWCVWCYLCDDEVPYSSSNRLGQLVDYVRKETNKAIHAQTSKLDLKEQEKKELTNKKLEKDSKNEKEKGKNNSERNEEKSVTAAGTNVGVTVKGFSNLGNTCFFNAVMQNLSQTPVLRELLKEVKITGTTVKVESMDSPHNVPLVIKLQQVPGSLTSSMHQFLTDIEETQNGTVTPKELFSQVCKKAIRFRGYQQQDSQELLRYLLDGMRAEEIQRVKVEIIKSMNDSAQEINEEEIKRKANEYEKKRRIPNFVDRIFGGELSSTIMCDECRTVSLVNESFLDLSLPVLDEQTVKKGTVQKNATVLLENTNEEDDDHESYFKEKTDTSSGTSKHLQKKAKKQAKKQAKTQRRQHKVLQLSDLDAAEGQSEGHANCDEDKTMENIQLENGHQEEEVGGLIQSVEHSAVPKEDNGTDLLCASENGKSSVQHGTQTVTKMMVSLEILGAASEDVNYNTPIFDKGSPLCLETVSPCSGERNQYLGESSPPFLERFSPCIETGSPYLIKGTRLLGEESPPCLEKVTPLLGESSPCLGNVSTFLEENSPPCLEQFSLCLETGSPYLKKDNQCLGEGLPFLGEGNPQCLEKVNPFLAESTLCLENGNQCLEEGNLCLDEIRPFLEEGRTCLDNSQCVKEATTCLENGSARLLNSSKCLDKKKPCLDEGCLPLEEGNPCFKEGSLHLGEGSPCLKEYSSSLEEGSTSLDGSGSSVENTSTNFKSSSPSPEKEFPSVESESDAIDELVNGFDELLLKSVVEPSNTHSDTFENCHTSEAKLYEIVNEDPETAFCTLADRDAINTEECSVESCLYQFTRNEKLSETNKLLCNVCTRKQCSMRNSNVKGEKKPVYTNAKKQMLISLAPPTLTLHLKRFQQAGLNLRKVNRHVKFPELIDIAPFCTIKCKNVAEGNTRVLYSLYGLVEHSGTLRSGHYTAFVKVRRTNTCLSDLVINRVIPQVMVTEPLKGQWYHISDTHVQTVPLNQVLNAQAYLLFYERIL